ncbi:hypothetical protein MNB_SV-4-878 [hydrothermal vent metagenome]|uniref:Lipoprotein n=1 Tax=hydrothermal vent metagenome TaxID=652676 RepID=A0A1W1E9B8_9ZZZZ
MKQKIFFICFIGVTVFSGCHELDNVLIPIHRSTEELNTTTSSLSIPVLDRLPYSDVHFKRDKIVMEKHF